MNLNDKKRLIDLKCDQTMKNPDEETNLFGPDYPTHDVNYYSVLVRCPANCHKSKNVQVYGLGIHPAESPICFSAIVDNAMSLYGGIFSISIFSGYKKYELIQNAPEKIYGFEIKSFGASKKSYVLAKVDNVDIVKKDIRILNSKGELSSHGRLEMRYEGKWFPICLKGNDKESAKIICRDIGYKDGEWKNPENSEGKGYCQSYEGENHCAAEATTPLFSNIQCSQNQITFNQCSKELANPTECTHDFDAIIKCSNVDYSLAIQIPNKTIKLEMVNKTSNKSTGRLELYLNGKYQPICHIGFNDNSAKIACKQMGFTDGKQVTGNDVKQYQINDPKIGFNAKNLDCKGEEGFVSECKMLVYDINCKHDQDVVIECEGKDGDISGKSQYIKKLPVPPPKLSKLGLPFRPIDCNLMGYELMFRGDPGSIYAVKCPNGCQDKPGVVWGTGVYTSDSYICRAGIHGGIIGPNGGMMLLIKVWGQKNYIGSLQNGNNLSAMVDKSWPVSFSLSQINSGWVNMMPLLQHSFIQEELSVNWVKPVGSLINSSMFQTNLMRVRPSSFIQKYDEKILPEPIFKWIPPSFTHLFSEETKIDFDDKKIPMLKDYTIAFSFNLLEYKPRKMFIFSYSGCGSYNIYLSDKNALKIGDFCDKNREWNTGFKVPFKDDVKVYIEYTKQTVKLEVQSSKITGTYKKQASRELDMTPQEKISIGKIASENEFHFLGKLKYFYVFAGEVKPEEVDLLVGNINIVNPDSHESFSKTVDQRLCVSRCSDNPIPPNPGCGVQPKEADINGEENKIGPKLPSDDNNDSKKPNDTNNKKDPNNQEGSGGKGGSGGEKDKDDTTQANGGSGNGGNGGSGGNLGSGGSGGNGGGGTDNKKDVNNIESQKITCETNLLDKQFEAGAVGHIFRVACPKCLLDLKNSVYGTQIYHPTSIF